MRYTNRRLPLPLPLLEGKSRSNLLVVHARLSMYLVRAINNSSDRQHAPQHGAIELITLLTLVRAS